MQDRKKRIGKLFCFILVMTISHATYGQSDSIQIKLPDLKVMFKPELFKDLGTKTPTLIHQVNHNSFPIFCKIEHKMSLNARVPVRIRLGNVDYVDRLEGKTSSKIE